MKGWTDILSGMGTVSWLSTTGNINKRQIELRHLLFLTYKWSVSGCRQEILRALGSAVATSTVDTWLRHLRDIVVDDFEGQFSFISLSFFLFSRLSVSLNRGWLNVACDQRMCGV